VTVSIRAALAIAPDGTLDKPLSDAELGRYLAATYDVESERARNARHARRDVFYRDGGCEIIEQVIDDVFQDPDVRALRKKWVKHARFSNVVKRIVNELSTVYAEPAVRSVGGSTDNQARYAALVDELQFDDAMEHANRMANLHQAVLVGPRVRVEPSGERTVVLDFATPAVVRAVVNPADTSQVIGWMVRSDTAWQRGLLRPVAWQLWTDHEVIDLDAAMVPVGPDRVHGLGVNRWVPLCMSPVPVPRFWPGEQGEDLIAAAVSIWIANVLLLKETKSATKQTIAQGDVSAVPRDQSIDTERMMQFSDGVAVTTVDMSMDTRVFTDAANHILERVGNGYGMSLGALTHQGVQSADARELMLEPLRALRRKQIKTFRKFERQLARVLAAVTAKDAPDRAFTADAWRIDFGEIQALTPKKQRMEEYIQARQIGLDNVIDFYCRENPDLTREQAAKAVLDNIAIETWRVANMRDLMALSGGAVDGPRGPDSPPPATSPEPVDAPHSDDSGDDHPDDMSWIEEVVNAA